jgi:acetylglutamate kinase
MDNLYIIKIGGNIINDEEKLSLFLKSFSSVSEAKILVHGGGKLATLMATKLGVEQTMVEGRRITDAESLKIVTMVYAGYINKNIVAQLQSSGCNAIGLCGADANIVQAHKRKNVDIDYGFAGDVEVINSKFLQALLDQNIAIVISPITHDKKGQLLNTNADTIAQEIAKAVSLLYDVHLIYCFEKNGVMMNANDNATIIPRLNPSSYRKFKEVGIINAGMIPKLENAFAAVNAGVVEVVIGNAENLQDIINKTSGTIIVNE